MSFDKITNVIRKKELIEIEISTGALKFYANELSYTQRVSLSASAVNSDDIFAKWISMSITDEDGKRMTSEQASNLPDDVAEKMFAAVMRVNAKDDELDEEKKS